jgi:hypothetical protein
MTDAPAILETRLANVERQTHTVLFLSAANFIANLATLILWALLSLA